MKNKGKVVPFVSPGIEKNLGFFASMEQTTIPGLFKYTLHHGKTHNLIGELSKDEYEDFRKLLKALPEPAEAILVKRDETIAGLEGKVACLEATEYRLTQACKNKDSHITSLSKCITDHQAKLAVADEQIAVLKATLKDATVELKQLDVELELMSQQDLSDCGSCPVVDTELIKRIELLLEKQ